MGFENDVGFGAGQGKVHILRWW